MSMMQEKDDRKGEREEKAIKKKWKRGREEGKRGWKNDQDAREGRREKGKKKGYSGIDDDGSYRSNISINFK